MARRTKKKPKGISGFLVDAHIPTQTVEYLTGRNYKVEKPPKRMKDYQIVQMAKRENMVLITQDSSIRKHVSSHRHPGIVIIHGRNLGSNGVTDIVGTVLSLFRPIEDIASLIIDISRYKLSITLGTEEIEIPL